MKWNFRLLSKMGPANYKFWAGIVTVAEGWVCCVCLQRCQQNFEKFFQCMENLAEKHSKFPQEWKKLRNLIPPKKERSAFRVRAFSEYCDVYWNFVDTSTLLTGALGCPTTEAGQRKRGGDETQFRSRATLALPLLLRVRCRGLDSWDSMLLNVSNKITI